MLENRNVRHTKPGDNKIHTYRENITIFMVSARTNGIVQYGGTDSNRHCNQLAKSNHSTSLFLTSMHNIGAIHISSKHGVSPRDQTTHNQRVSGTILVLKSRILELDRTRLCAARSLFNLGGFVIGRDSYQQ